MRLSTSDHYDVKKLFQELGTIDTFILLISVEPRHQGTGLLEEQGDWILATWGKVLKTFPKIVGCRVLWNMIFFALPGNDMIRVEQQFTSILQSMVKEDLESRCAGDLVTGTSGEKVKALDHLQLEVTSKLNFGTQDIRFRLLDGNPVSQSKE